MMQRGQTSHTRSGRNHERTDAANVCNNERTSQTEAAGLDLHFEDSTATCRIVHMSPNATLAQWIQPPFELSPVCLYIEPSAHYMSGSTDDI